MIEIPLTKGYVALIDDEDAHLAAFKWYAAIAPNTVYAVRSIRLPDGRQIKERLHRAVLRAPDGVEVDHRDGNGLDCRRANLRVANYAENAANRVARGSSGFKGVTRHKCGKWQAVIERGGRPKYLGLFEAPEAAARAYDRAARELHGEFARPNFPENTR